MNWVLNTVLSTIREIVEGKPIKEELFGNNEEAIIRMMLAISVDYIAVAVAAIAAFAAGMVWYSPAVMGKKYMKVMGKTEKEMKKGMEGMQSSMIKGFIMSLIMAYVLAYTFGLTGVITIMDALQGSFWLWLGFVATTLYGAVIWEKKSMDWFVISAGHYLVSMIVMGIVLVSM